MSPVRDDSALGPDEDLDRDPDGVPHEVVGGIIAGILAIAAIVLMFLSGHVGKHPGAVLALGGGFLVFVMSMVVIAKNRRVVGPHASR